MAKTDEKVNADSDKSKKEEDVKDKKNAKEKEQELVCSIFAVLLVVLRLHFIEKILHCHWNLFLFLPPGICFVIELIARLKNLVFSGSHIFCVKNDA